MTKRNLAPDIEKKLTKELNLLKRKTVLLHEDLMDRTRKYNEACEIFSRQMHRTYRKIYKLRAKLKKAKGLL